MPQPAARASVPVSACVSLPALLAPTQLRARRHVASPAGAGAQLLASPLQSIPYPTLTLPCCTGADACWQGFDEWSQKMATDPGVPWEQREEKAVGRWVGAAVMCSLWLGLAGRASGLLQRSLASQPALPAWHCYTPAAALPCPLRCRWTTYCAYVPQQDRRGNAVTCAREAYKNHTWDAEQKYTSFEGGGMKLSEQRKFKYTFSTDGLGCSNRFQKLLATGQARPSLRWPACPCPVLAPAGGCCCCAQEGAARVGGSCVAPCSSTALTVWAGLSLRRFPCMPACRL